MLASLKRIVHFLLIIAAAAVYFLIPDLFSSCERFDYERVIIIETGSVTEKISDAAKITGRMIDLGESKIVEHGHIWAKKSDYNELTTTLGTKTTLGSITARGDFTSKSTGLSPDTEYEVRAYATNSKGTVYGKVEYFRTPILPILAPEANFEADHTNIPVGEIVEFTDLSSNDPSSWEWDFGDGGSSMNQNPTHQYTMIGLYTVYLTVSNSYGSDTKIIQDYITVAARHSPPVADFMAAPTTISAGENVQFNDLSLNTPTDWYWDFGDGGSSTLQNPLHTYESAGIYSVSLMVSNPYGSDTLIEEDLITVNESAIEIGTYIDSRDGHEYKWVKIGEQVWMAENLAYLPNVSSSSNFSGTEMHYYVYNYDGSVVGEAKATFNYATYGVLYNWPAAMSGDAGSNANPSGVQGICPDGWHLPSYTEWFELIDYLGGGDVAGGALKESGLSHWLDPNTGATNSSGFTGLPGGTTYVNENIFYFTGLGSIGYWWTSFEIDSEHANCLGILSEFETIGSWADFKRNGNSVRCVQDGGSLKSQFPAGVDDNLVQLKRR